MKNTAELIRGIEIAIEGLSIIKNSLISTADKVTVENKPTEEVTEVAKTTAPVAETVVEDTASDEQKVAGKYTVEELKNMRYNEFKKLAVTLGVKCTGTRDEILNRILALNEGEKVSDELTAVEEEPVKSEKKPVKSVKEQEEELETDEFVAQAESIAKETSVEDIIEALSDVGVKATKKNFVVKLADALRKGLLEVDDEEADEEETDSEDSTDNEDEEEIMATSYFSEYDPKGFNDPDTMSNARKDGVEEEVDKVLTDYSEGKLSVEDMTGFIEEYATEEEIELLGDDYSEEDVLKFYIELVKRFVDNDGEKVEPNNPYELGENDMCCGQPLKYNKKFKTYICEHCGEEYEAE